MGFHISPCTGTNTASFISHQEKGWLISSHQELRSKKEHGELGRGIWLSWRNKWANWPPDFPHCTSLIAWCCSLPSSWFIGMRGQACWRLRAAGTSVG